MQTRTRSPEHRIQSGFSLVELLVVIAIIGVLTALLAPTLARAKSAAKRAACVSNLRQLGLASHLYWGDNDNKMFPYRFTNDSGGTRYWFGWIARGREGEREFKAEEGALFPYLKGRGVEACPSLNLHSRSFKLKARGASYGYGYNLHLSPPIAQPGLRITQLKQLDQIALLTDAAQVNTFQSPASPDNPMLEEFYYFNSSDRTVHFRHEGTANVLFLDGHVSQNDPEKDSIDQRLPPAHVGRLPSTVFPEL